MRQSKTRLATLKKLREATRDERLGRLAEAVEAEDVLATEAQRIAAEMAELDVLRNRAASPQGLDVNALLDAGRHRVEIETAAANLRQQAALVGEETKRRREAVIEADRELKTIDKLEQKYAEQERQSEQRRQVRETDEVAIQLHVRKRGGDTSCDS